MPATLDLSIPLVGELLDRTSLKADVGDGCRLACAVSGGADSLTLLVLAAAAGAEVTAIHVDHGTRGDSSRDADVVRDVGTRLGAAVRVERLDVAAGSNYEARARAARYGVLPPDVLTGHTMDDQAETVLLHLLRGAGLDGLAAMRPDRRHPLLGLRRRETARLCSELGLDPVRDPMNDDPAFRRNRVRAEVLPLLDDVADRDVVPLLARTADLARDARDVLAEMASDLDPTDARGLAAAPRPLARVAIRRWLQEGTGAEHPPSLAAVDRALAVAHTQIEATEIEGGWRVARTRGVLRLESDT